MTSQWQYQVRFDVNDSATAESVRRKLCVPALAPLFDILAEHRAALKCQFDAFAEYYPLYQWTKATIENPAKKEKYLRSFTVYVDDREVYAKEIADALEADLQPLATSGLITRISKYDTNPANNPQPPPGPPRAELVHPRERTECPLLAPLYGPKLEDAFRVAGMP